MNSILRQLVAAVSLGVIISPVLAQQKPQAITVPITDPGEPIRLEMSLQSARIEIIGEQRKDAVFEVSATGGQRRIVTPSGTRLVSGGAFGVEIEEEDNEISFDADWRADKVRVVARLPKKAHLEINTVNDSEIIVRNIEGDLKLKNVNGPITATGISGSVIAASVNADVKVHFDRVDGVNASSLETINGDLYLGLRPRAGVQLQLDTARGEIYSDFEVEVEPGTAKITRDNTARGSSLRIENVIVAKINGGGPVVRMKGLYGDIHIEKTK